MIQFDHLSPLGKESLDAATRALGTAAKGGQAIAVEIAGLGKQTFEQGTAALEKLAAARSLETVMAIQGEFARASYEGLVSLRDDRRALHGAGARHDEALRAGGGGRRDDRRGLTSHSTRRSAPPGARPRAGRPRSGRGPGRADRSGAPDSCAQGAGVPGPPPLDSPSQAWSPRATTTS